MLELGDKLAHDFSFVRVDFYDVNGRIYFGEMTFSPGSGIDPWIPKEADLSVGRMIKLPGNAQRKP